MTTPCRLGRPFPAHAVLSVLGLLGFLVEAAALDALQWEDASVASWFASLRGCNVGETAAFVTQAGPYAAIAFFVAGLALAWRRRARIADVGWTAGLLGAGLLLTQVLKVIVDRRRPGLPPWAPVSDSFPSGHVMNAALLVGAAFVVVPRRSLRPDWSRLGLATTGTAFVTVILLTRLYLGRHWLSDAVGSLLLSSCVLGLMSVRGFSARTAVVGSVGTVLLGLYIAAASGAHVDLPSPSAPALAPAFRAALRNEEARAAVGLDGVWVGAHGGTPGFLRLSTPEVRVLTTLPYHRRAVLRVVVRRLRHLSALRCVSIDLFVDGRWVASQPLSRRWRSHAFALPALAAGRHEFRLHAWPCDPEPGEPVLALRGLEAG